MKYFIYICIFDVFCTAIRELYYGWNMSCRTVTYDTVNLIAGVLGLLTVGFSIYFMWSI